MKLIYISHWRFPSEKTMSPLIMKTCEEFARVGFEVELWTPRRQNSKLKNSDPFVFHGIRKSFVIRQIPVIDVLGILPGAVSFWVMVASFNVSLFFYTFFRRVKRGTIFYFHDTRDALFLLPFRYPAFCEIHDFYRSSVNSINRWAFRRMRGLIVTNRVKIDVLKKEYGVPEEKMLHQPNGVDISMFAINLSREEARKKLNLPTDKKLVLYTGHLFSWKGVDTLLEAAALLPEDYRVYFVGGTDSDIAEFKVKCQMSKVKGVVVAGRKPHLEIPMWLRAADVLVLPNTAKEEASKYETSPVKLFEYMASGRPIVASNLPSIHDIVDESMVAFAEPDNAQAFAEVICHTVAETEGASGRAQNARAEVQKYSWDARTQAITDFIKKRLGSGVL